MILRATVILVTGLLLGSPGGREGGDRVGAPAPELPLDAWLHSPPLKWKDLRGQVVLLRWWTDAGCPYCTTTAPSLRQLQESYGERGLRVIGVFHPKPAGDRSVERARRAAERFGFAFPIALDPDWNTLRRWWLDGTPRQWTSVSFLVDKKGIIRYVHPGGEFRPGDRDYREIEKTILRLLAD